MYVKLFYAFHVLFSCFFIMTQKSDFTSVFMHKKHDFVIKICHHELRFIRHSNAINN